MHVGRWFVVMLLGCGGARTGEPTAVAPGVETPAAGEQVVFAVMPAAAWQVGAEDPSAEAWALAEASLTGRVPLVLQKASTGFRSGDGQFALLANPHIPGASDRPPAVHFAVRSTRGRAAEVCAAHPAAPFVRAACEARRPRLDHVDARGTGLQITSWFVERDGVTLELTCGRASGVAMVIAAPQTVIEATAGQVGAACMQMIAGLRWHGQPVGVDDVAVPRASSTVGRSCAAPGPDVVAASVGGWPGHRSPGCLKVEATAGRTVWTGPGFRAELAIVEPPKILGVVLQSWGLGEPAVSSDDRYAIGASLAAVPLRSVPAGEGLAAVVLVQVKRLWFGYRCAWTTTDGAGLCAAIHGSLHDQT